MPSSVVHTFSDPDDYGAAVRATKAEITVTGRGQFAAKLIKIDLHRLWMQRFFESLPRVAHSATMSGRAIIVFRTQPGPSLLASGTEMEPANMTRLSEGHEAHLLSSGESLVGSMSLPGEDMASIGATIAGCDLTPQEDTLIVTPPPSAMARLLRLHAAAGQLAKMPPKSSPIPERRAVSNRR